MADPRRGPAGRGSGKWHRESVESLRRRWANDPLRHGWSFYKKGTASQPVYRNGKNLAYFAGPWMEEEEMAWWVIGEGEEEGTIFLYPEWDIERITAELGGG